METSSNSKNHQPSPFKEQYRRRNFQPICQPLLKTKSHRLPSYLPAQLAKTQLGKAKYSKEDEKEAKEYLEKRRAKKESSRIPSNLLKYCLDRKNSAKSMKEKTVVVEEADELEDLIDDIGNTFTESQSDKPKIEEETSTTAI
ncbi:unnamed protein product [Caenorhabditis angaria]|uniref:Uncharacterized protein n=1 Tax=Caenorhabditis angaria TaxID=860376 RepID=A0A9P1IZZ7_9PELO|nr:unnamed protein product [Caenorhabditis angaria]